MMTPIHKLQKNLQTGVALLLLAVCCSIIWPAHEALAKDDTTAGAPAAPAATGGATAAGTGSGESDVCTNFAQRKAEVFGGGGAGVGGSEQGLLSDIYIFIKEIVGESTQNLYNAFINDARYQKALGAVMTLSVVFFTIAFTMGLVQVSYGQLLTRLVKFGVILSLLTPGSWYFFSDTVVHFFNDGTDDLVTAVIQIGTGVATPPGATPFFQFDKMAEFIINPETIVMLMGMLTSGPYGLAMMGLMAIAVIGFVTLLIDALKKYAISFVARSLLLGIAPIFLTFMLFERTKQLFTGWLNALLSMSLQPILMFTFLSFFMVLIETASQDMLSTEFCWTDYKNMQGTVNNVKGFRPVDKNGNPIRSDMTWNGAVQCLLGEGGGAGGAVGAGGGASCPEFPIDIINVLTFLILVYIANRFSQMVEGIANELSNSFISLDTGGKISEFLSKQGGGIAGWLKGGAQ